MRTGKLLPLTTLLILFLIAGCAESQSKRHNEVVIFAAASLTNAFEDLSNRFEDLHPNTEILLSFSSSSQLAAQILEGVPGDLFASANQIQMEIVENSGEVAGKSATFATNTLQIAVPKTNPMDINTLEDLCRLDLRLVLAVPNTPIREYTDQLIERSLSQDQQQKFFQNLASEEANVRQVVTKIALGEADAGIVYASDITPDISDLVIGIPISTKFSISASYPIAVLERSQNKEIAEEFIKFTLSDEGQSILQKWGFGKKP